MEESVVSHDTAYLAEKTHIIGSFAVRPMLGLVLR